MTSASGRQFTIDVTQAPSVQRTRGGPEPETTVGRRQACAGRPRPAGAAVRRRAERAPIAERQRARGEAEPEITAARWRRSAAPCRASTDCPSDSEAGRRPAKITAGRVTGRRRARRRRWPSAWLMTRYSTVPWSSKLPLVVMAHVMPSAWCTTMSRVPDSEPVCPNVPSLNSRTPRPQLPGPGVSMAAYVAGRAGARRSWPGPGRRPPARDRSAVPTSPPAPSSDSMNQPDTGRCRIAGDVHDLARQPPGGDADGDVVDAAVRRAPAPAARWRTARPSPASTTRLSTQKFMLT